MVDNNWPNSLGGSGSERSSFVETETDKDQSPHDLSPHTDFIINNSCLHFLSQTTQSSIITTVLPSHTISHTSFKSIADFRTHPSAFFIRSLWHSLKMAPLQTKNNNQSTNCGGEVVARRAVILASAYVVDRSVMLNGFHYSTAGVDGKLAPLLVAATEELT